LWEEQELENEWLRYEDWEYYEDEDDEGEEDDKKKGSEQEEEKKTPFMPTEDLWANQRRSKGLIKGKFIKRKLRHLARYVSSAITLQISRPRTCSARDIPSEIHIETETV
jgi:hypothetical protein